MSSLPPDFIGTTYDLAEDRERVRSGVSWTFIILFAVIVLGYAGAALFIPPPSDQWNRFKEVMEVVLPAVTGTLGTALGFYFGSQSRQS